MDKSVVIVIIFLIIISILGAAAFYDRRRKRQSVIQDIKNLLGDDEFAFFMKKENFDIYFSKFNKIYEKARNLNNIEYISALSNLSEAIKTDFKTSQRLDETREKIQGAKA